MSETKFTPGPWFPLFLSKPYINICHSDTRRGRISQVLARVTAAISWRAESEANAHLIAAAPGLYEAAKLFEKTILYEIARSQSDGDEEGARMKTVSLNVLRETLAKAEGRTHEPAP